MSPDFPRLEAKKVTQSYGYRCILNELDLVLHGGEVTALMGSNGAGKTTLMKVLCGLIKPRSGEVALFQAESFSLFTQEGYLFDDLTVEENLNFYRQFFNVSEESLEEMKESFALENLWNMPIRHLSLGQKTRTALARTFLMPASFYFLDEPFGALDQVSHENLLKVIKHLRQEGRHILIATHLMERAQGLFNRILYLEKGKIRE
ncbi:MAG: ABC transporter ATP-binding protein [Deltaproteobacteria bacterium]|nr:MAG: ABC transporter ATP-binding protein [Deltaproteobacteria bacterium]